MAQQYGVGTTSIGGLTIDNPLRLEKTAAPKSSAPAPSQPTATPQVTDSPTPPVTDLTYTAYDPAAAARAQASADFNSQRDTTYGSITDRVGNEANTYNSGILDFIDSLKSGQSKVDAQAVQNELAKRQGAAGVLDMVGHGIRSGGVILANKNASNSSAGEALANAYGDIGRRQLSGVGNQYEQGKSAIAGSQADLDLQKAQGLRHLNENKTTIVNGIVSDAQDALSKLNAAAASASLPDRIDIEAEKQRIRNEALTKLQEFDAQLSSAPSAASAETNRARAATLDQAGTAADNAFQFTTDVPTQLQNTGPFASDLPLFTYSGNKKQNT